MLQGSAQLWIKLEGTAECQRLLTMPEQDGKNGPAFLVIAGVVVLLLASVAIRTADLAAELDQPLPSIGTSNGSMSTKSPPVIDLLPPETRVKTFDPETYAVQADLLAQRWMAWSGVAALIVTTMGVALVAITVWQTRGVLEEAKKATSAANDTVKITREIAYGQLRPYVGMQGIKCVSDQGGFQLQPVWKNFGQTPATNVRCMLGWAELSDEPGADYQYQCRGSQPTRFQLPPSHQVPVYGPYVPNSQIDHLISTQRKLFIWGWLEYGDTMDRLAQHRTEFCQALAVYGPRDNWKIVSVGPHNGSDGECLIKLAGI